MLESSYSTEPITGHRQYKLSAMLQHYLSTQIKNSPEEINSILEKVDYYSSQLQALKSQGVNIARTGIKALEDLHNLIPAENKESIKCKMGCTACCYIDLHISADEALLIIEYCEKNNIEINLGYLQAQANKTRKEFSEVSGCVFLKNNLCMVYEVRPAACRKHFVNSDPAFCDSSKTQDRYPDTFFDLHTEIFASAILNISETNSIEIVLLDQISKKDLNR